jgi:integrase
VRRWRRERLEAVPELRWHLDRFAAAGERGLVFTGPKGAAQRRSNFRPIWNAATAKAGVSGLHFHDLRHVGGTLAATTGCTPGLSTRPRTTHEPCLWPVLGPGQT